MLYAQWCLDDVERVEEILDRNVRVTAQMQTPFTKEGVHNLNRAYSRVMADMERAPRPKVKASQQQIQVAALDAFAALRDAVLADPKRLT